MRIARVRTAIGIKKVKQEGVIFSFLATFFVKQESIELGHVSEMDFSKKIHNS